MSKQKNVVVAMSGGVDSSVAAALLVEQGLSVRGMMLKLWDGDPDLEASEKRYESSVKQAQSVATRIGIPFEVIDASTLFQEKVVKYFLHAHQIGLTPNPCYICNKQIKWGLLLEKALEKGADFLATGHYARLKKGPDGLIELHKGVDHNKDQSYVLAGLSQSQFAHALLPLGEYKKEEVRKLAHRLSLDNFDRPDSQDLCFLGGMDQKKFLALFSPIADKKGDIVTKSGQAIGAHQGLSNYTIGQRKGLGAGFMEPIFVLQKDIRNNLLIVGKKTELGQVEIWVEDINWISGSMPILPSKFNVKIRYKATPLPGTLTQISSNQYKFSCDDKVRDATPGQFAVFYSGEKVIGGGVIRDTFGEKI